MSMLDLRTRLWIALAAFVVTLAASFAAWALHFPDAATAFFAGQCATVALVLVDGLRAHRRMNGGSQ